MLGATAATLALLVWIVVTLAASGAMLARRDLE
jgi:hypothetical protein